jgi:predicted transcriptional regulator
MTVYGRFRRFEGYGSYPSIKIRVIIMGKAERNSYKKEYEEFWNKTFDGIFIDTNCKLMDQRVLSVTYSAPHLLMKDIVSFKLSSSDIAVMSEALEYCDDRNHVLLVVEKVAGRIYLQPDTVKKSITNLVKVGMLERLTNQIYLVDPVYIWKGTEWDRSIALRKRMLKSLDIGRVVMDSGV